MTNYEIELELRPMLAPGEKFIWTGRPRTGIKFSSADIFMIPFSLAWGGFALFWEATVIIVGAPFFFALFGIPFVIIGYYMLIGRFFYDARKRKNTIYAVTTERIITRSGTKNRETKSVEIRGLSDFILSQKTDGSGTITFGQADTSNFPLKGMSWKGTQQFQSLEMIEDVNFVYEKIMHVQRQRSDHELG